mmetsp:Transcript_501/g.502  ORF Transcript_501/g.502 Transcript_501/m.502 type:complete len:177 (+) Transcript_501:90-620(+)|eukprot:CAMPEP_0170516656 /NCGR_PEP_ID=MMETSP0209-20121228/2815_1 /TAXON_ID=665100 ORGANISM="Litonotus pictus, Strain P1" /NCGR_SAMPLE_ID=MMETSP0209 /ASSEMBLY_ACC=CAM_ASM_000301 /LENGTH=176 /DNA_ID=CAMNT_0010801617 /DNA_START=52 /DNA_END=582 /DNA_ORIENTATION=+
MRIINIAFLFVLLFAKSFGKSIKSKELEIDSSKYYWISSNWLGDDKVLGSGCWSLSTEIKLSDKEDDGCQKWKFTPLHDGWYRITGASNHLAIDVIYDDNKDTLVFNPASDILGQPWKFIPVEHPAYQGYSYLQSWIAQDKYLDIVNAGNRDQVKLKPKGNYTGMMWKLTEAPAPK